MKKFLNANALKCIALFLMLLDHLCMTVVSGNIWMHYVGRLAFPIFCFQLVEGFYHTSSLKSYKKRLLIFALISEIPFNLMMASSVIFPFHQNVIFTLLLGLVIIECIEAVRRKEKLVKNILLLLLYLLLSAIGFVDYGFYGVMTILVFYFFRTSRLLQLAALAVLYLYFFKGEYVMVGNYELTIESLCILALPIIWLYDSNKPNKSSFIKGFAYWFYPVHMLLLYLPNLLF